MTAEKNINPGGTMLAGLAIGLAIGLLFAPRSGEETRKRLKDAGLTIKDKAKETKDSLMNKAGEVAEGGIEKAKQINQQSMQRTAEVLDKAGSKAKSIRTSSDES